MGAVLFIDAQVEGYSCNQCRRTMTVGELIECLAEFDEDTSIYLRHNGGYTFGSISESDFTLDFNDEAGE